MTIPTTRLLHFARELQRASTFGELLLIARDEVEASLGYRHAWVCVAESEHATELRLIDVAGAQAGQVLAVAATIPIKGDAMIEEIMRGDSIVVVEDARTDPRTNKVFVEALGNRTIINVALRLVDQSLGVLGIGTFADEGCRPPKPEQLDYLLGMASQLSVAAGRIRLVEERRRADAALEQAAERVREGQKMEAIGRLAGSIAHDFNNLLSVIIGYSAEMLADASFDGERRKSVEAIRGAAGRAADLTRQLLAFGRRQVLAPRTIDPNATVRELERMVTRLMSDGIETRLELQPDAWPIEVDPGQLEQVLMNLALNARDAMPQGGRLTIETANVELDEGQARVKDIGRGGPHVLIAVSDTGSGMTPEVMARIFEPFFTTKGPGGGTGLGLSSAFGIVKQSGGSILVYSEPGRGSSFKLYFPRSAQAVVPQRAPRPEATPTGHEVVLVVEDEPLVREVASRILQRYGYEVMVASGGPEALAMADARVGPIHLLLTDVVMSPMGGRELSHALVARRPDTRVLFMSGYTENAIAHQGILDADVNYIPKPFTPDGLARRVRAAIDGVSDP